jgi:outer membrane lipoprotein LolB
MVQNSVHNIIKILSVLMLLAISACTTTPTEKLKLYSKTDKLHLYSMSNWSFEGRLAITGQKDSWSANIDWQHSTSKDEIKLSGPLGQGATVIRLTEKEVIIDRGSGHVQSSNNPEQFINQQLGMFVPVNSLRYWVLGLPEPSQNALETSDGFNQLGWLVSYLQMQSVDKESMPRKVTILNDKVKLKLIIDHWNLNDSQTK